MTQRLWLCLWLACCVLSWTGGYVAGQKAAPRFACACDQREAR